MQVRSATLDTWLPDQVAFIQSEPTVFSSSSYYSISSCFFLLNNITSSCFLAMGNQKSNSYWEAELPAKSDRVGIENFIRAKYDIIVNHSPNYLTITVVKSLVS